MARNERAQWARMDFDGTTVLVDLAAPLNLARTVEFAGPRLHRFGAPAASSEPLRVADFGGRVDSGASCNCSVITLTPHANGTHTESVGHLTHESLDVQRLIPRRLLLAVLLTVEPELAGDSAEGSVPMPCTDDRLITQRALLQAWPVPPVALPQPRALIVRTLPNDRHKFIDQRPAPFLSQQAAAWLVERDIEHLVLDVPSADRAEDGGALTAHRLFFGLPPGSAALSEAQRRDCTLTELAYVDDAVADGWYLLSLQSPAIAGDAVPSRPVIYPLRAAR